MVRARVFRSGVSEMISITLLILIAVTAGVAVYYAGKAVIDAGTARFGEMAEAAQYSANTYLMVDAYYITSNETLVIYLYTNDPGYVIFNALYVNGTLIPPQNLSAGFNTPVKIGEMNRLSAVVSIKRTGPYDILVVGTKGVRSEGVFNLEVGQG